MTNPLRWPLYAQTLLAMIAGCLVGLAFGPRAGSLAQVANWIIHVIKFLAIPLLFLAIYDAVIRNEFRGRGVASLVLVCILNGLGAVAIGLAISNIFRPGRFMPLSDTGAGGAPQAAPTTDRVVRMVAESPMVEAIVLGIGLGLLTLLARRLWGAGKPWPERLQALTGSGLAGLMRGMGWVVHLVPIAVFASMAKVLGEHGFRLLGGLGAYFFSCLLGMILHVACVYHGWVLGYARIGLRRFWRFAREPVVYAFGVNSSLATLPVTLKALEGLKVSPGSARLSACMGTNFNNDGVLLYEVVAVLFMSQAYGLDLSFGEQLVTAFICVLATIGVGGIPEAGIISLALVLGAVKLPLEGIPLLLGVDWVLARCRSSVNVLGDMTVAIAIDRISGGRDREA